jgi:sugar/nucleoside kinase (ribokinase family)
MSYRSANCAYCDIECHWCIAAWQEADLANDGQASQACPACDEINVFTTEFTANKSRTKQQKEKTMNVNDLTLGQIKELQALLGSTSSASPHAKTMVGEYVIVRCRDAGVHCGVLQWFNDRQCYLKESRRMWSWDNINGDFLSGIAKYGPKEEACKFGVAIDVVLTEDCEIIRCTPESEKLLRAMPSHRETV